MGEYQKLIKEIYDELDKKDSYPKRKYYDLFVNNPKYKRLEEHNLWIYWQGRGVTNPKIMVVGQDWGSIEQSVKYYEYIKKDPEAKVVSYVQIKKDNPKLKERDFTTDKQLQELFEKYLGYPDICNKDYKDIYFTNLIPGYRDSKSSTGNNSEVQKGITKYVIENFKNLLEILQPKVIICLGKIVSESIAEAYGKKDDITKYGYYNKFLDVELNKDNPQPIELKLKNGHRVKMFAIAHLGSYGKGNRNKYLREKGLGKDVKSDWEVVGECIKSLLSRSY